MYDGVYALFIEEGIQGLHIANIDIVEGHALAAQLLYAGEHAFGGIDEIVRYDHLVPGAHELYGGVGADIAAAARKEYAELI